MRWYVIPDIEIAPECVGQAVQFRMWDHGSGHSGEKWDCGACVRHVELAQSLVTPVRFRLLALCQPRIAARPLVQDGPGLTLTDWQP